MSKRLIIDCWDNGGETTDRYSIAISGFQQWDNVDYTYWLGASEDPFHPQGFGQHCGEIKTVNYKVGLYNHLGKRIRFDKLPEDVRKFVSQDLL